MASLFKSNLLTPSKDSVPASALAGKTLGLYFSAHWCPPCRGFTPQLVEWFAKFKASHANKDDLELVFVSSDRDQSAFDEYWGSMKGFHALPFDARDEKGELSKQFSVKGIPTLVFVAPDGTVLTSKGREVVSKHENGEGFPWAEAPPKSVKELLGGGLKNNKGDKFASEAALAGKTIGLYFSAHWCPPCRGFTPTLAKCYNTLKARGDAFEVVFVSSDRDEAAFNEYFGEMPWLALDLKHGSAELEAIKEQLDQRFEVEGIPTLVLLDKDYKVLTMDGTAKVRSDPTGADFPWPPKPLNPLDDGAGGAVNEGPFLVAHSDGTPAAVAAVKEALAECANAEFAKAKPALKFFYVAEPDHGLVGAIARFARLKPADQLYIVNAPANRKYIAPSQNITAENVKAFVASFLDGTAKHEPAKA